MKNMEISDICVNPVTVYFNIAVRTYVAPKRQIKVAWGLADRRTAHPQGKL